MTTPHHDPLSEQIVSELRQVGHTFGPGKNKRISGRVSEDLMAAVKNRLGVTSDTEAIEMALAGIVLADDFGIWLTDQSGALDEGFGLEL